VVCVYCGAKTRVYNSRLQKRNNQVWRRRKCERCLALFTSHEAMDLSSSLSVLSGGSPKPFMLDMLFTDLLLALQDRPDCYLASREATSTAVRQLLKLPDVPVITPKEISTAAAKVLKRLDRRAYLRYVAEHRSLQRAK